MTRLHHVGFSVSDLELSIEFYCAIFACAVRERSEIRDAEVATLVGIPAAHLAAADLELENGEILELIQYLSPSGKRLAQERNQPGHTHVAFLVDDLDAIYNRLVGRDARPTSKPVTLAAPGSAWDGMRAIYVCDPDGRTIECIERPRI